MKQHDLDIVVRNLQETFPPLIKKINTGDYMQKYNLTPTLARILFTLKYHNRQSLSKLGKRVGLTTSNCSRAVERLFELDYIERNTDENDRRRTLITLSQEGDKLIAELRKLYYQQLKKHLSELSSEDIKKLKESSEQIHAILSKLH